MNEAQWMWPEHLKDTVLGRDCRRCRAERGCSCIDPRRFDVCVTIRFDDGAREFCYERVFDYFESHRPLLPARVEALRHVAGLHRAIEDHVAAIRTGDDTDVLLTELALHGGIATYLRPDGFDLSDEHVDRVALRLYRAFDDDAGPISDNSDNWRTLAREAIRLGAGVAVEAVEERSDGVASTTPGGHAHD